MPGTVSRTASLLGDPRLEQHVDLRMPLPPGAGYAVSAASAVAAGLVMAHSMRRGYMEALVAAHEAEILESTGLGDVLAISCGVGVVVRYRPGAPGVGGVECFQVPGTVSILSVETGRMPTASLLSTVAGEALGLADRLVERVLEEKSIEAFIEASERFSRETGLLSMALSGRDPPRVPGLIGFYGKKRVLVFLVEREWVADAAEALRDWGAEPRLLEASQGPPRVWWA